LRLTHAWIGLGLLLAGCKPDLEPLAKVECLNIWTTGFISAAGPTPYCGKEAVQSLVVSLSGRPWRYMPSVYEGLALVKHAETMDKAWGLDLIESEQRLVLRNGTTLWVLKDEKAVADVKAAFAKMQVSNGIFSRPAISWPLVLSGTALRIPALEKP
jgi:hypothetical protein